MLTERTFDTGSMAIHYVEGPASGLPLIMLHGITLRWQHFLPVLPLFSFRYHTFALDFRGHGLSGRAVGAYGIEEYGEDVVHFLRTQVTQPAVLMGQSLGAEIAMWVAASAPDLTRAVILEEPGLYTFSEGRFSEHPIHQRLNTLYTLLSRTPSMAEIILVLQGILPAGDSVGFRNWATSLHQLDPEALAQMLDNRTFDHIRPDEVLPKIKAPVLLIQGNPELESLLAEADVERARLLLAHCSHVRRPDIGHHFHSMYPMDFFQLVSSFLESL